jgi:hypothetical protein
MVGVDVEIECLLVAPLSIVCGIMGWKLLGNTTTSTEAEFDFLDPPASELD